MHFIDKNKILFILCVILSIFLMNQKHFSFVTIEDYLFEAATPVIKVASQTIDYAYNLKVKIQNIVQIYEDNQLLREKNTSLKKYFYLNQQLEEENDLLKKQLNYLQNSSLNFITVPVIGRTNGASNQFFIIDAGAKQNIKVGQMILYERQLVGRIVKVNKSSSRVLLLTDPLSGVPVKGLESGVKFIAKGQLINLLSCKYLKDATLQIGELVVTTNDNPMITPNIIVGKVVKREDGYFIQPNINFDQIDMVQILFNEKN